MSAPLHTLIDATAALPAFERVPSVGRSARVADVGHRAPVADAQAHIATRSRSERLNRIVNVALATLLLLLLAPILLVVAVAIKMTSPGPVFYRQTRIGLDRRRPRGAGMSVYDRRMRDLGGSAFVIYKFRSMCVDAERGTGVVWAQKADPRVTPIGRLLRKTRIDEIPQLLNVIRGDMNIVGPRPERPSIVERLRTDITEYSLRHRARPGITGWAQINQCYDSCLDDVRTKVRLDLEYITRQGMAEDVRIMMRTIPVVLFRRGGW